MAFIPLAALISAWGTPEAEAAGVPLSQKSILKARQAVAGGPVPNSPAPVATPSPKPTAAASQTAQNPTAAAAAAKSKTVNRSETSQATKIPLFQSAEQMGLSNLINAINSVSPQNKALDEAEKIMTDDAVARYKASREMGTGYSDVADSIDPILQTINTLAGTQFKRTPASETARDKAIKEIKDMMTLAKTGAQTTATYGKLFGGTSTDALKSLFEKSIGTGGSGEDKWRQQFLAPIHQKAAGWMQNNEKAALGAQNILTTVIPTIIRTGPDGRREVNLNAVKSNMERFARSINDVKGTMTEGDIDRQIPASLQKYVAQLDAWASDKNWRPEAELPQIMEVIDNITAALNAAVADADIKNARLKEHIVKAAHVAQTAPTYADATLALYSGDKSPLSEDLSRTKQAMGQTQTPPAKAPTKSKLGSMTMMGK